MDEATDIKDEYGPRPVGAGRRQSRAISVSAIIALY